MLGSRVSSTMYTDARTGEKRKARYKRRSIPTPNYVTDESNTRQKSGIQIESIWFIKCSSLVRQTALNSAGFVQFNMRRWSGELIHKMFSWPQLFERWMTLSTG